MTSGPKSPSTLERLFQTNIRMSPSRSRKPMQEFGSRRHALNRAAYALSKLKEARLKYNRIIQEQRSIIGQLEQEYYKLARRAAFINNANMKSGPLQRTELSRLHKAAGMIKTISTAVRTLKHTPLPHNVLEKIAKKTVLARA